MTKEGDGSGARLRRAARRTCFAGAAGCLLVLLVATVSPAQDEEAAPRPEVFRGAVSAQAISVSADRDALLPIADLFKFIALDGSSVYESSAQSARSSLLFPGNGIILGPNLLCGTFLAPYRDQLGPIIATCSQYKYPLTVYADEFTPDDQTTGALKLGASTDPVSGNAIRATAHAAPDGAKTDAVMNDLSILGLPVIGPILPVIPGLTVDTSLLKVDSATARTNQRIVGGALVVDASAVLSGVHLVGGLVGIGSIRSESHVTDDAKGKRTATSSLEVSGVTVAGVPSQITQDGLVVGSPTGGLGPLVQQLQTQLNQVLQAIGLKITLLGAEHDPNGESGAVASAGGLLIELAQTVQGLQPIPGPVGDIDPNGTYVATIQLGQSAARGAAFGFEDLATDSGDTGGSTDLGFAGTTGGDVSFPELTTPSPGGPTITSPGPKGTGRSRSIADIFEDRLGLVYLALALTALGLCIAPRFAVPARLPGPPS